MSENILEQNNIETVKKKVSFHTMGCRLNFSETGSIVSEFMDRGYETVEFGEAADVVFINTCTVTDSADSSARHLIRKAVQSSPEGKIVVAGCYAQMEPEAIKKIEGVDYILGTSEKFNIFKYLDDDSQLEAKLDHHQNCWGAATSLGDGHTRAFLKIQDGCNYVCSFCIIPFARGRSRTISVQDAILNAQKLVDQGFKEIVLTGVNIGEYESKSGEKLSTLVRKLAEIKGLQRLRLSSVEPNTFTDELLLALKETGIYQNHFHIPLQSGSNEILSSMKRKYLIEDYQKVIARVLGYFPKASIGADIIVGYPGETETHFEETKTFLENSSITHFHLFPYSKRKNTAATRMTNHLSQIVKKERLKILEKIGQEKLEQKAKSMIGKTTTVLLENKNHQGLWQGYTSEYFRVSIPVDSDKDFKNQIKTIQIMSSSKDQLFGEIK